MNDLERDLRELFDSKVQDASISAEPAPRLVRRARRRQVATVAASVVLGLALVVASIAGISALTSSRPQPTPVGPPEEQQGLRSVTVPHATLTYPSDWYLLELGGRDTPRFQLSNFDPGLETFDCGGDPSKVPAGGVLVTVLAGIVEWVDQPRTWPVELDTSGSGCDVASAAWQTPEGDDLIATASFAPDASADDRKALAEAFASLVTSGEKGTENFFGSANLVLDSADSPVGPVALYAYRDGGSAWLGIAGPAGTRLSGGGQIGHEVPLADESVTMNLDTWGGVIWGDVSTEASRAELQTVEGGTYSASLIRFPQTLGVEDHQAVWGIVEGQTADRVTTLLYDAQGNPLNTYFPTGARVTVATGTDPEAGDWQLYLEPTNDGTGLGFRSTHGGGGSGCCLQPLKGDFQLDGWGSGSNSPGDITALASEEVTRIEFEAASGERIDGGLYPVPDVSLGIPQVGLVIVPSHVALEGQLVAYSASGDELGREDITSDNPEPPGPTTEIDVVWERLRNARNAIQDYAARHQGSLSGLAGNVSLKLDPFIRWNEGQLADGQVSVRGAVRAGGTELTGMTGWTVVLVSATVGPGGSPASVYCIGVNIDENGGGNFRYGTQDAANYADCRGGWPELNG
jgi:hypothetical protein